MYHNSTNIRNNNFKLKHNYEDETFLEGNTVVDDSKVVTLVSYCLPTTLNTKCEFDSIGCLIFEKDNCMFKSYSNGWNE